MPDYTPYIAKPNPVRPKLTLERTMDIFGDSGLFHYGWDADHVVWADAPKRRRLYVCAHGATHARYWRRHQKGGNSPIELRCEEHEILFTNAAPLLANRNFSSRKYPGEGALG